MGDKMPDFESAFSDDRLVKKLVFLPENLINNRYSTGVLNLKIILRCLRRLKEWYCQDKTVL